MKNFMEFKGFVDSLDTKTKLANGDCSADTIVTYKWKKNKSETENLKITFRLTTAEGGRINMDEGDRINSDKFHLDFDPEYQTYTFDEDNKMLIVEGSSGKMGGDYRVEIVEE